MHSDHGLSSENYSFQKVVLGLSVVLLIIKFAAWWMTSSVAVLTDALESIVNVVAAVVGLYAIRLSSKPKDKTHPYGHGKIELISSLIEGTMILVAGIMIIFEAIGNIINPRGISDLDVGLILIAIAAIANFAVGSIAISKGKKNRSMALEASGRHLCSDTVSSVGIIAGLAVMMVLTHFGFDVEWIDSLIAAAFGAVIITTGVKVVKKSLDGIMDRMEEEVVGDVISLINSGRHSHWVDLHNLRVTKYGHSIHIELHMVFPGRMSVSEQNLELQEIVETVKSKYGDDVELNIQGEPCKPSLCPNCSMECEDRESPFVSIIEWTADTATDSDMRHQESKIDV